MNKLAELIIEDAKAVVEKTDYAELAGKSILITGSSGLMGTFFTASLNYLKTSAKLPFKTYCVIHNPPAEYFKDIAGFEGVEILQGDLTEFSFCRKLPRADFIIHAAGYGQPSKFMSDPIRTIKLNTTALLELGEKLSGGGKLLFVSTSEVYAGLLNPPYKETDIGLTNTSHPRACYIESKRCGEAICNAYRHNGIEAKSARLSLAYGPGTRKGDRRVINEFIYKGLSGEIYLLDKGLAKRAYCYVSDAVEIMWNILFNGSDAIYNVGGISKITIGELAKKIGDYLNVPVTFKADKTKGLIGAPEDVSLDMSKVEKEFNKKQYVDLTDGLARIIEWQKLLYAT